MFEYILLQKLLNSGEFFSKTITILKEKYFTSQGNKSLFSLIHNHYIEYSKVPTMTELIAQIKNVPNAELRKLIVDDIQQIHKQEVVENTDFMLKETVKFVKDSIFTEALILGSDALESKDDNQKLKARELMEEMTKISLDTDLGLDFDNIEAMIKYYQNKLIGVLTQHTELNKRLGTGFLPGTLSIIMAASGVGKCSKKDDYINIYKSINSNPLKVTYEELFELLNLNSKEYYKTLLPEEEIFVDTPNGLKKINAAVIKPSLDMLNIKFENGKECNVAENHIFSHNGNEVFAKDITYVDTKYGEIKVKQKTKIGKYDGYDINIDYPHWYYSGEDIIYHNTLLMTDLISGNIKENKNALLVSMEMQENEMMKRVHANALDLPINKLTSISPDAIRAAKERLKTTGKFFVKDYPTGSFSPLMLDSLLDQYEIELGVKFDIVYLDYLGIMKSDLITPNAGLYSYIKSIVEETRAISTKRQIPIVSASQLNRCLDSETIISTVNGDKKIKDIVVNDVLENIEENNIVYSIHKSKKQRAYKIKLKSGKEIICSGEHKFPTNKGTMTINVGLKKGLKLYGN